MLLQRLLPATLCSVKAQRKPPSPELTEQGISFGEAESAGRHWPVPSSAASCWGVPCPSKRLLGHTSVNGPRAHPVLYSCCFSWGTRAEQGSNSAGTLGKLLQPLPGCPAQHRHRRQTAETGKGSALGAGRKRRPKPDKAASTFPAWHRAGNRGGSRKHLGLELPAKAAETPGRCYSLSAGASRGQRRRAGVSKGQQWGKKRTITSTPSCPDPPLLPGRAQIFPTLGAEAPLYPTHFPSRGLQLTDVGAEALPPGGRTPASRGTPDPSLLLYRSPRAGAHTGHTPIRPKPPQKKTRDRPQPRTEALHRRRGGLTSFLSAPSSIPSRFSWDIPADPPLSPTAPRGRSSELGVPPVLPPPSPRQRRAARPHRSAPLPARPRPVPPQFGGGGGQRVGMGAGPVGLKLLRVSSGFPPGFFLPPRPGFWPPGGCGAWGGRTGREEVASPCGLVLTPEEPPWVLFLQAWGSPDVGALPKSPQTPQTPGQLGLGSSDPVLTGGQRGWDRKGWCGAQHPWMLRDWGWVLPPYTQWGLRGARPRVGPGHCTQCLVHCCHSTARFVCVKGNCFVWN